MSFIRGKCLLILNAIKWLYRLLPEALFLCWKMPQNNCKIFWDAVFNLRRANDMALKDCAIIHLLEIKRVQENRNFWKWSKRSQPLMMMLFRNQLDLYIFRYFIFLLYCIVLFITWYGIIISLAIIAG